MASGELKIELELRMYEVVSRQKRWWQFWIPKTQRKLISFSDYEASKDPKLPSTSGESK